MYFQRRNWFALSMHVVNTHGSELSVRLSLVAFFTFRCCYSVWRVFFRDWVTFVICTCFVGSVSNLSAKTFFSYATFILTRRRSVLLRSTRKKLEKRLPRASFETQRDVTNDDKQSWSRAWVSFMLSPEVRHCWVSQKWNSTYIYTCI